MRITFFAKQALPLVWTRIPRCARCCGIAAQAGNISRRIRAAFECCAKCCVIAASTPRERCIFESHLVHSHCV